jgi:hypothetical protein
VGGTEAGADGPEAALEVALEGDLALEDAVLGHAEAFELDGGRHALGEPREELVLHHLAVLERLERGLCHGSLHTPG